MVGMGKKPLHDLNAPVGTCETIKASYALPRNLCTCFRSVMIKFVYVMTSVRLFCGWVQGRQLHGGWG